MGADGCILMFLGVVRQCSDSTIEVTRRRPRIVLFRTCPIRRSGSPTFLTIILVRKT